VRAKRVYFFALAPVFARPKSEKCFKLAETQAKCFKRAETLAPQTRALTVDKLNAIFELHCADAKYILEL